MNVDNWIEMCGTPVLRKQIALMGCSCCEGRKGINLMAHGSTFLRPFGQRKRPLRLMRKRRILSFAKFLAKGTHRNAPCVTFTCVEVAWMNILAILMLPSSP